MYSSVIYDGTWKGLLTAIFVIYERRLKNVSISKTDHYQPTAFSEGYFIETEEEKADRVLTGIKGKVSGSVINDLFSCFLSEKSGIENTILAFIQLAFSKEKGIENAYGHTAVLHVSQISKMVHREKHRMEAFIRFQLIKDDDLYYACIEPDFNVLPLIVKHFKNRYADQKWIVYDTKRKYGIFYDLKLVNEITFEFSPEIKPNDISSIVNEDEAIYQTLWKDYFKHVNIEERKNIRLHLRNVPKRYWKFLTEKM